MEFKTWDEVVTYVYWTKGQMPPTDASQYAEAKANIIEFHKQKGYKLPSEEK